MTNLCRESPQSHSVPLTRCTERPSTLLNLRPVGRPCALTRASSAGTGDSSDLVRRRSLLDRKHSEPGRELEEKQENSVPDYASALDDDIGDDLLRLIFRRAIPC
jgi:hypothetical protein